MIPKIGVPLFGEVSAKASFPPAKWARKGGQRA